MKLPEQNQNNYSELSKKKKVLLVLFPKPVLLEDSLNPANKML